jgi:ADP-heptose:LPS heptosyltransferase
VNQRQSPLLLFPTHYLGNFVLGLPWVLSVLRKHPDSVVVLDAQFEALARLVLHPEARVLLYPRKEISKGQRFLTRLTHYWNFLRALRRAESDTVLDLEGERFTGVLARLSGCQNRVGPKGKRAETFYTDIRDPNYQNHRYNTFGVIVDGFTDDSPPQSKLAYEIDETSHKLVKNLLRQCDDSKPLVAIHPGASVSYKLWPRPHFVELVRLLDARGCQIVWVGAGDLDAEIIDDIRAQLPQIGTIDLCNRLSFVELTALYKQCTFFVGSDSGPMHLAASTGLPVFALFGPSDEAIWAPLGDNSHLVRSSQPCGADCNAFHCSLDYRCMKTLGAEQVEAAIEESIPDLRDKSAQATPVAKPKFHSNIPVSAYIITLNEAANIGACLDRLVEFDEVILVDSGSTDGTVEIANQYPNVKSSYKEWEGFSAQKAHAMSLCSNEWVFNIDADEIVTDEFLDELRRVVAEDKVNALESARILYRWGTVPRNLDKQDRLIRLFRKSAGQYLPRRVHECVTVEGEIAKTDALIEHYENLTYTQRIDKANKYSQARAEDKFEKGARGSVFVLIFIFPVTFIQMYFFKGHFLDGVDGLLTSMNSAFYAFMKYAKLWELKKGRGRKR